MYVTSRTVSKLKQKRMWRIERSVYQMSKHKIWVINTASLSVNLKYEDSAESGVETCIRCTVLCPVHELAT